MLTPAGCAHVALTLLMTLAVDAGSGRELTLGDTVTDCTTAAVTRRMERCLERFERRNLRYRADGTDSAQRDALLGQLCRSYEETLQCLHVTLQWCPADDHSLRFIAHRLGSVRVHMHSACYATPRDATTTTTTTTTTPPTTPKTSTTTSTTTTTTTTTMTTTTTGKSLVSEGVARAVDRDQSGLLHGPAYVSATTHHPPPTPAVLEAAGSPGDRQENHAARCTASSPGRCRAAHAGVSAASRPALCVAVAIAAIVTTTMLAPHGN